MTKKFQYKNVLAVSLGHLFHDIFASFLSPIIPLLVEKLGITVSLAGLLDVIRNAPTLFTPFLGLLVERFPVKYLVICAPAVTATVMSLLGLAPSYGMVVILIFVAGLSSTLFHIPSPVLIKRYAGDRTGAGMSYYMLGGELSRTLGPLVITAAISLWGFEGTWRLIPFGCVASVILFFSLRNAQGKTGDPSQMDTSSAASALKEIRPQLIFIGSFLLFSMAIKVSATLYLTAFLVNRGRTLVAASFMLSVLQFSGAAGTLIAGSISDKLGKRTILLISAAACPVLLWSFPFAGTAMQVPILIGLGLFLFAPGPVILALVQDAESRSPAFANGLYMTVQFIIRSFIVFMVGIGIDTLGFMNTYQISAILGIGAAVCVLLFPKEKVFRARKKVTADDFNMLEGE